jgi:nucleotide sugar dehydrogenase
MIHRIGIIGHGFVGVATESGLQRIPDIEIRIYDKYKDTESLDAVVEYSDVLFVCVPTPMNFETGECNLSIVEEVVSKINEISPGKSIVIKSTVPPGTTARLAQKYPRQNFVFNPEFLTEKNFVQDFINQDRIILGSACYFPGFDSEVFYLYKDFTKTQEKPANIKVTTSSVAEMVKYMGNCFLATKVAFCNEICEICQSLNIDYKQVYDLVSLDTRIGPSHMKVPGHDGKHGFGGSCFPKDLNALIHIAEEQGIDPLVLETVWTKNLLVREEREWEKLAQVTGKYEKK